MTQKELAEELRQGSEAKHLANRLTPDGKELVEMIPMEWAIEVINADFISKDDVLKARPVKKHTGIEIPDTLHRNIGYNEAIKDWSKALGLENKE